MEEMNKEFKSLIKPLNLKQPIAQIARITGFSKALVSGIYNDKSEASENFLRVLKRELSLNKVNSPEPWTMNEPEQPFRKHLRDHKINAVNKKLVPFYDTAATATNTDFDMSPISSPAGTIDVGDLLDDSQAAIRIYGNSMLPNYPPGCVVGLVQTTDQFIQPGEVYVIETNEQRLLKRMFYKDDNPDSEIFTCYSDNVMKFEGGSRAGKAAYPPFNLSRTTIRKLFIVTGVIKRNTNSIIINRKH